VNLRCWKAVSQRLLPDPLSGFLSGPMRCQLLCGLLGCLPGSQQLSGALRDVLCGMGLLCGLLRSQLLGSLLSGQSGGS
jgi:hypothetical protein